MNTNNYTRPEEILSIATAMVNDRDHKILPKGFYYGLIQKAFEELALDTFFQEVRKDIDLDSETLTMPLPEDCFNLLHAYIFTGEICNIQKSHKLWHKANYYTQGVGYFANNKVNNQGDPFYGQQRDFLYNNRPENLNGAPHLIGAERVLFYNIENGSIMVSASCRNRGSKIHLHYNGTGCAIGEAPIIPVFLRTAIEDYVICYALQFRMATDSDPRRWQSLWSIYNTKLREPFTGSWDKAEYRVKNMNSGERDDLFEYLGRPSYGSNL